jgi:hypothetical protein
MRLSHFRLTALAAAFAAVAACDSHTAGGPLGTGTGGAGSGSGGLGGEDRTRPLVSIDTPTVGTLINVGDSVLVAVHLRDAGGLASVQIRGVSIRGSADLGTAVITDRYEPLTAPATGKFRAGLRDTVVRRYLKPKTPIDTVQDSVVVIAIGTDAAGNLDTATSRLNIVAGPKVITLSPASGDSVRPGTAVRVQIRATHGEDIARIGVRVTGEASWPTPLDVTRDTTFGASARDVSFTASILIPADAPGRGRITIMPFARDVNQIPGSATPIHLFVQAGPSPLPRVTQVVPARAEITDTIVINAGGGDGIRSIGFEARDSNTVIRRDSVLFTAPFGSPQRIAVPMNLPTSAQGRRITITSFAIDATGRYGFSVPATANLPQGEAARALADTSVIVYGRTFKLPRTGIAGDLAVDVTRGNVFVSNTSFNRLEVWSSASRAFDANGVAVGSEPWGMTISALDPNELLVANSGGTNISRVDISAGAASSIRENLGERILTRNTYIYVVTETREEQTGKIRLQLTGPFSYSDRPQYIAQSAGGRIYYSTKPTSTNTAGTIRWLDPALDVPDPQQIWQYGDAVQSAGGGVQYAIFNVDSIAVLNTPASSPEWDKIRVWDHPYGERTGTLTAFDSTVTGVIAGVRAAGNSDAFTVANLNIASLALTDTTFVAASGNAAWIGFGEGNTTSRAGRLMLVNDPGGAMPGLFSPGVTVRDILDNASERVFGLALDLEGTTVAAHGAQSYFAAIQDPFHLRLQGKYDSFDTGAGIAFHPDANGVTTPEAARLAFVASSNGSIELMDAAYYINRGRLNIKGNLYGPLRVTHRFASDPAEVVLKVFGLTTDGLVVIDLRAADIKAGP